MHKPDSTWSESGFDTRAIHAGQPPEPTTGAVMVPIFQTSTYAQKSPGVHTGFEYTRTHNPTRYALEDCVASLEGGTHGVSFASGCAASSVLMHLLKTGDHVVCGDDVYGGTYRLFTRVFREMGSATPSSIPPTRPRTARRCDPRPRWSGSSRRPTRS